MSENGMTREVLAIRQADFIRPAFLSLSGTVLMVRETWWAGDVTWYLPVEWVTLASGRRRSQRRLIIGVVTFLGLLLGSFLGLLSEVLKPVSIILFFLAFLSLTITLVVWMRRRPTVVVTAEPAKTRWEFFEEPDPHGPQRRFLEDLRALQAEIHEIESFPAKTSIARSAGRRWRKLVQLTLLFMVPGIVTERANLLLLALLPAGWELVRHTRLLMEPRSFRVALRRARQGQHPEALEALRPALDVTPAHKPSLELFFEGCMEIGRHEEAFEAIRRMRDLDPERAQEMEEDRWVFLRIHERMKKPS